MNLKKAMYDKIEKNSIKIEVEGEEVYLKKSGIANDWHVIYPPLDLRSIDDNTDEYGNTDWEKVKWNKTNLIFGGKGNAIKTLFVAGVVLLTCFGVYEIITSYATILNNPFVQNCLSQSGITLG